MLDRLFGDHLDLMVCSPGGCFNYLSWCMDNKSFWWSAKLAGAVTRAGLVVNWVCWVAFELVLDHPKWCMANQVAYWLIGLTSLLVVDHSD